MKILRPLALGLFCLPTLFADAVLYRNSSLAMFGNDDKIYPFSPTRGEAKVWEVIAAYHRTNDRMTRLDRMTALSDLTNRGSLQAEVSIYLSDVVSPEMAKVGMTGDMVIAASAREQKRYRNTNETPMIGGLPLVDATPDQTNRFLRLGRVTFDKQGTKAFILTKFYGHDGKPMRTNGFLVKLGEDYEVQAYHQMRL